MVKQAEQQRELHKHLWDMANDLRGNMDANSFKDYILGLIFYRYLSETLESTVNNDLLIKEGLNFKKAWEDKEIKEDLREELLEDSDVGYIIEPEYLYSNLVKQIKEGTFTIETLQKALNNLEESTEGYDSEEDFRNLFEDLDLTSSKLGRGEKEKSDLIGKIMLRVNDININFDESQIDVLGDAYEYLISQFAASAGKKAGEFYTPQAVSEILTRIVTSGKTEIRDIYDPTCGSGSLLLRVADHASVGKYYGQEKEPTTYNLARMNMMLHGVPYNRFDLHNNDTIENPADRHQDLKFEAVVANPPYSAKWSADKSFQNDERFSAYGRLAPKSKADYAFVQHMIHHLDDHGTMGVVLPHGVLFRGAAEETIRKYLIEDKNYLDAVIGLPANIFYGTSIPTTILIFKKCKETKDILFIDASNEYEKNKNKNALLQEHIDKIVQTYEKRETIDKYSYVASLDEIRENEYNLNIPRYVDTFEEEEPVDLDKVREELNTVNEDIEEIKSEINKYLKELDEPELK